MAACCKTNQSMCCILFAALLVMVCGITATTGTGWLVYSSELVINVGTSKTTTSWEVDVGLWKVHTHSEVKEETKYFGTTTTKKDDDQPIDNWDDVVDDDNANVVRSNRAGGILMIIFGLVTFCTLAFVVRRSKRDLTWELVLGVILIAVGMLAFGAANAWYAYWNKHLNDDLITDDDSLFTRTRCGPNCAIGLAGGLISIIAGILLVIFSTKATGCYDSAEPRYVGLSVQQ